MQRAGRVEETHWNGVSIPLLAAVLLGAGLVLRGYFVLRHPFLAGDSYLYQDIAQNWLHEHIYGLSTDAAPRPTLIRLPGYPAILAALSWLFDRFLKADPGTLMSFLPVLWLQVLVDLCTCALLRSIARRAAGERAGLLALALACLCPFTANYTAVPLTETFTLFFLTLAFYLLLRWLTDGGLRWLCGLAASLSAAILLRPDQGLLTAAILPVLYFASPGSPARRLRPVVLCCALIALPFLPWTARNAHTFGVFQPLAPRLANDPGEIPPLGFQRWFRTWAVDFSATEDAYWNYPDNPVRLENLPERAFDSADQRAHTAALLGRATANLHLDRAIDAEFSTLAVERIRAGHLRYYVALPAARLANMLLHPRTEMLPVAERWWQYRKHPAQTVLAWLFGVLNAAYFVAALCGFSTIRKRAPLLTLAAITFMVLRCMLLLTLDNAEQRYTLEFLPLLILFASGLAASVHPAKGSVERPPVPGT